MSTKKDWIAFESSIRFSNVIDAQLSRRDVFWMAHNNNLTSKSDSARIKKILTKYGYGKINGGI